MVTIEGDLAYINGETTCNINHFAEYIETDLISYIEMISDDTDYNDYKTLVTEVLNRIISKL